MEPDKSRGRESGTNQQPPRHQNSDTPKFSEEAEAEAEVEAEAEEISCNYNNAKGESKTTSFPEGKEILKAIEVVERDSVAIAQSFTSLFASLRLALSQIK